MFQLKVMDQNDLLKMIKMDQSGTNKEVIRIYNNGVLGESRYQNANV